MASKDTTKKLQPGTHVFYPAHGVAEVLGVEERDFGASAQQFFALELDGGNRVLLPVENVAKAGVRELVPQTRARKMLERVVQKPTSAEATSRRQRVAKYKEELRTGEADSYTEILQNLLFRSRSKKLASDEKRLFEEARGYFVSEIATVLEKPREEILDKLSSC